MVLVCLCFISAVARGKFPEVFNCSFCAGFLPFEASFLFAFFDGDTFNFHSRGIDITWVARRDRHKYIQAFHNLTEHTVLVIQVWRRAMSNKELRAIGSRSRVRHGEDSLLIMFQTGMELIFEFITRTS